MTFLLHSSSTCLSRLTPAQGVSTVVDMTLSDDHMEALEQADLLVREAKAMYDHTRAVREELIREVAEAGGTYREIAELSGVSYQRVAQVVTGGPPPTRGPGDWLNFECPKCGAPVGDPCIDRGGTTAHLPRHHLALRAFFDAHPELG